MKDSEVKKIYLHAFVAMVLTLLVVVASFIHGWQAIGLAVFEGILVFILALLVTSFIAGD